MSKTLGVASFPIKNCLIFVPSKYFIKAGVLGLRETRGPRYLAGIHNIPIKFLLEVVHAIEKIKISFNPCMNLLSQPITSTSLQS